MSKKMHLYKVLILLISMSILNACGFHLRSAVDLPEAMKKIYLQDASAKLQGAFKKSIRSSKGELVANPQQAGIIVNILEEEIDRRSISLSSRGKSTEYEINYYLTYELRDSEDKLLIPEQTIEIIKDYYDNQVDVIAKDIEGNLIRDEIYREAVRRMIDKARFELKKVDLQPST